MARKTIRRVSGECPRKMGELGYKEESMRKYVRDFGLLADFADGRGARRLSPELAQDYVDSLGDACASRVKEAWRACNLLEYFEGTGEIAGRGANADVTPPVSTARYLELYIAECHRNNLAANTMRLKNKAICHFLWYLEDASAKFPDDVDAEALEDWAAERADGTPGYTHTHSSVSAVRCFLRHLFSVGVTEANLAELVPKSGRYPNRPNTKMWTDEELRALIDSIPTSDSAGMRDRAICLLLVTYGMRSLDICALTLGGLDFDAQTITYESPKTGARARLPMTDAVWESLAVWLRYGRPSGAACPNVFTIAIFSAYAIHVSIGSFERPMTESVVSPNDLSHSRQYHLCLPFLVFPFLATHVPPHLGRQGWSSSAPCPAMSFAMRTLSSPSSVLFPSASSAMIDLMIPSGTSLFVIPGTPFYLALYP